MAIPKKIFNEVGFFPEGVPIGGDLDMWMRIGAKFSVAVSCYIGAVYHRDAENRIDTGKIRDIEYELVKTGSRLLSSAQLAPQQRKYLREYICMYQINTAAQLILLGRRSEAMKILLQCKTGMFFHRIVWWLFWALFPTSIALWVHEMKKEMVSGK